MSVPSIQTAFSAGEIAPSLYGHVDLAKSHVAATTLRNMFVNYRGGAYSRAGTALCLRSKQPAGGAPPRVITFQFNINQGYALEFGDYYMRVYSNGAPVVEAPLPITAISNASPCVLTVSNTWKYGDWIILSDIAGVPQINGSAYVIGSASGSSVAIYDLNGNPVDSTTFGSYTGGGSASRVYTLVTPYAAVDLPYLKITESADTMSLTCVNQVTGVEYPSYDLARITASNWTLTPASFAAGIEAPAWCTVTATTNPSQSTTPPTLPAAYAYVVTVVSAATGEESVASPVGNCTNSVDIASTAGSLIVTWAAVSGGAYYNIYKAPTSYNTAPGDTANALPVPAGAIFGYVGTSYGTQFVDSNITADDTQVPPVHANPFARGAILAVDIADGGTNNTTISWTVTSSAGAGFIGEAVIVNGSLTAVIVVDPGQNYQTGDMITFTGDGTPPSGTLRVGPESGTYPGTVAYYQQRRVYAASLNDPDTYWMSKPGAFLNMDASIPSTDADAITGTPWAQQVNGIQFMVPMPGGLVVLTGLGSWQVTGAGGSALNPVPITPSSEQAQPQAFNGCSATVPPIQVLQDILYVQAKGSVVRDLAYNYWVNIYTGSDLTQLSGHLFTGYTMLERAWCEEPYKMLWLPRNDGALLSLTYIKEQEVYGWARHDTFGSFVSVCSVTEPPVDALYLATLRPTQGAPGGGQAYYIERMNDRIWASVEDVWGVDCALATSLPEPAATLSASAVSGADVIFTASSGIFSSGSVGQVIRANGGIATITSYVSPTKVTGTWNLPCSAVPTDAPVGVTAFTAQAAGNWTLSTPTVRVFGLTHLIGQTVTGLADGVPVPPTIVSADGSVTLPFAATDIKLGLGFTAQVQTPYLDVQGGITVQGRRKNITAATVRLDNSLGILSGTNQPDGGAQSPIALAPAWGNLVTLGASGTAYTTPGGAAAATLFTGDARVPELTNWAKPGQIAFQQSQPLPMSVLAVIPETMEGDTPEQTYAPEQQRQRGQTPRGPGAWMLAA